jgi:hypothetical protein
MRRLLCNDIKQLIHRYVFDYNYKKTRREYKREYLKYWNDETHEFFGDEMGCNYRGNSFTNNAIYRMVGDGYESVAKLPRRYYYTVLPQDLSPQDLSPQDVLPEVKEYFRGLFIG